jgi:hypothetical protein
LGNCQTINGLANSISQWVKWRRHLLNDCRVSSHEQQQSEPLSALHVQVAAPCRMMPPDTGRQQSAAPTWTIRVPGAVCSAIRAMNWKAALTSIAQRKAGTARTVTSYPNAYVSTASVSALRAACLGRTSSESNNTQR